MRSIKAIIYNKHLIEFKEFCKNKHIKYDFWKELTDTFDPKLAYKIDLKKLNNKQLKYLITYFNNDELLKYDYLIVWD